MNGFFKKSPSLQKFPCVIIYFDIKEAPIKNNSFSSQRSEFWGKEQICEDEEEFEERIGERFTRFLQQIR